MNKGEIILELKEKILKFEEEQILSTKKITKKDRVDNIIEMVDKVVVKDED